jgi:hypothetical protein
MFPLAKPTETSADVAALPDSADPSSAPERASARGLRPAPGPRHPRGSFAFTLIELLVSTALASLLTAVCISAFQQGRANIERAESRVRMHANAQTLYAFMEHSLSSLMQDTAIVTASTQSTGPGTGDVTLLFMHGKEDELDWMWLQQQTWQNSDHEWEVWQWSAATQNLSVGTSSFNRYFALPSSGTPFSFKPNGPDDYAGQGFLNLDQPRRTLSATNPWLDLDSNVYFPSPGSTVSLASIGDVGDWTDLNTNLAPVLTHVSDFSYQLVLGDSTFTTIDDTTTTLHEIDGSWLDGRIDTATAAAAAPNYQFPLLFPDTRTYFPTSAIAHRPRLLRVRFTLTDPVVAVSQTFSFSFALPGLAGVLPPDPTSP